MREIEKESKIARKIQDKKEEREAREIKARAKQMKEEFKQLKREEKQRKKEERTERNRRIKMKLKAFSEKNVSLPRFRKNNTKPVIDESGVA